MMAGRFYYAHRALVAGVLFGFMMPAAIVSAAEDTASAREEITVSPVTKEHSVEPGEVVSDSFKVINTGQAEFRFSVYSRPFSTTNEAYTEHDYSSTNHRSDAYSWVQFEQVDWQLEPGKTAEVNYQLRVPNDAIPGGHYGVLFAETQPDEDAGGSVPRKKRVGSILKVAVAGDIVRSGKPLETIIGGIQFSPPLHTVTRVKNDGTIDQNAKLTLTTKDVFGNVKYRETKQWSVYPDTTRAISFDWEKSGWFGLYNVEVKSSFNDNSIAKSQLVLMMPRWLIVLVVVALIGGGYALYRRRS